MDHAVGSSAPVAARIGPNAVIRLEEALRAAAVDPAPIFARGDVAGYLRTPPDRMVPEAEVSRLYGALHALVPTPAACRIADDAGMRTGRYLLERRIPKPAQALLRLLPAALAARALLALVSRHSWTFAGSATLTITPGNPVHIRFDGSPLCREVRADVPVCDFYCGTFRCLFRALVSERSAVREIACAGRGDEACVLEITW